MLLENGLGGLCLENVALGMWWSQIIWERKEERVNEKREWRGKKGNDRKWDKQRIRERENEKERQGKRKNIYIMRQEEYKPSQVPPSPLPTHNTDPELTLIKNVASFTSGLP